MPIKATCAEVIQRFAGQIAQYLGDGLLVYFGYPQAHDDDAQRAVRAGLGIIEAMDTLNDRLAREQGIRLAIRVGIHTGLVVVGAMGGGRTPGAARPGRRTPHGGPSAKPGRVGYGDDQCDHRHVWSTAILPVSRLECRRSPQVLSPSQCTEFSGEWSIVAWTSSTPRRLTPLVGREQEVGLLLERWAQVKEGMGQVVLVSGEAGIGKSRLVQVLKEHVANEPHVRWECRVPRITNTRPFIR